MNMGGLNKNKERIQARKRCVCGHVFGANEYKALIGDKYYCWNCRCDME